MLKLIEYFTKTSSNLQISIKNVIVEVLNFLVNIMFQYLNERILIKFILSSNHLTMETVDSTKTKNCSRMGKRSVLHSFLQTLILFTFKKFFKTTDESKKIKFSSSFFSKKKTVYKTVFAT